MRIKNPFRSRTTDFFSGFCISLTFASHCFPLLVFSFVFFIVGGAGNAYPSGAPDITYGFHRGLCCLVICVSLCHVIVLSFGFLVLIVAFV